MSEKKYTVQDTCIVRPDGKHSAWSVDPRKSCEDLNSGRLSDSDFSWVDECEECECLHPKIIHEHVHAFRMSAWDEFDRHAYPVITNKAIEIRNLDAMSTKQARELAVLLVAAAEFLEDENGKERA